MEGKLSPRPALPKKDITISAKTEKKGGNHIHLPLELEATLIPPVFNFHVRLNRQPVKILYAFMRQTNHNYTMFVYSYKAIKK